MLRTTLIAFALLPAVPALAQDQPAVTISIVTGLSADDALNIRATATPFGLIKDRVPSGTPLANHGCRAVGGYQWCEVERIGDLRITGWTPGRYLRAATEDESAGLIIPPPADAKPAEIAPTNVVETPPAIAAPTPEKNQTAEPVAEATARAPEAPDAPSETLAPTVVAASDPDAKPDDKPALPAVAATTSQPPLQQPNEVLSPPADVVATTANPEAAVSPARPVARSGWDHAAEAVEALAGARWVVTAQAETPPQSPEPLAQTGPVPAERAALAPRARATGKIEPRQDRSSPATARPIDLSARLGASADEAPVVVDPRKSAETIGQTAASDAYGLAFVALAAPPENDTGDLSSVDAVDVETSGGIATPDAVVPLPSPRPDLLAAAGPDMQTTANTQPPPSGIRDAALSPSTDAGIDIPCARYIGQPMTRCRASVRRSGDETADVVVAWPDGGSRIISFRTGKVAASDSRDALRTTREGDLNMIRIGSAERFEILDAFVFGG